jgi:HlyD family secretion protein
MNKKRWLVIAIVAGTLAVFSLRENPIEHIAQKTSESPYVAVAKGRVDVAGGVISLAAQRDGIIREVLVEEGQQVKKDQILAVQDTRQAEIQVGLVKGSMERAQAQLGLVRARYEFALRNAKRHNNAAKEGAVSRQVSDGKHTEAESLKAEFAAAKAAVSVAVAELHQAEFEIEVRNIRAPFDGRIVRRNAKPGAGLSTLNVTELFQLAPDTMRIIRADVDEEFIDHVRVGMHADVISETDPDQIWSGEVIRIGEVFGSRRQSDDPNERQDLRVVDTVLVFSGDNVRIGQRVLVKIKRASTV